MLRFFFKKYFIFLLLFFSSGIQAQSLSPRGSITLPTFFPLKNAQTFDETSFYLSSVHYSITLTSYLPEHIQKMTSRWNFSLGASWVHGFPLAESGEKLPSYLPAFVDAGLQWELDYLPIFITPVLGLSYVVKNPFQAEKRDAFLPEALIPKYFYLLRAGIFLSFDILNRYSSKKLQHEYNIQDMGVYAEYRKYIPVQATSSFKIQGWGFGLIIFF